VDVASRTFVLSIRLRAFDLHRRSCRGWTPLSHSDIRCPDGMRTPMPSRLSEAVVQRRYLARWRDSDVRRGYPTRLSAAGVRRNCGTPTWDAVIGSELGKRVREGNMVGERRKSPSIHFPKRVELFDIRSFYRVIQIQSF
jgi:hypothetical protein